MIKKVVAKHLNGNYKIFLFGSQAGLPDLIRADIDIGIDAERKLDTNLFLKIYADIENLPMLYKFDLIDFNQVNESFKNIALKNIEIF